jgi:hypothetical protein
VHVHVNEDVDADVDVLVRVLVVGYLRLFAGHPVAQKNF